MLDVYTIGSVRRISPEAPIPILLVSHETKSLGGAANVANNIHSLGADSCVIGYVGNDAHAQDVKDLLESKGIEYRLACTDVPTITKNRVVAGGQQIVRIDREEIDKEAFLAKETQLIADVSELLPKMDVVVISDYQKGVCSESICQFIIKEANKLKIPVIVDPKGQYWDKYHGATTITPNLRELSDLTMCDISNCANDITKICQPLVHKFGLDYLLVTRSEKGISYIDENRSVEFAAVAREVSDVSGAGDTVVATLAVCLAAKMDVLDAISVANTAAGIVVGKVGTQPITNSELELELGHRERTKILDADNIKQQIAIIRKKGKKVVFTNGCFDILHLGHITYLQQASKLGDVLIVGVNSDNSVRRLKGSNRPINKEKDRVAMLSALSCVDYVVVFDEDTPYNLISEIRPDVLVKGGDYKVSEIVGREFASEVRVLPFVSGYSTTQIVSKIKEQN